ncbi:hypothetical protein JST97_19170 [bacterium]|nr:hypothetical protein [bacterium]
MLDVLDHFDGSQAARQALQTTLNQGPLKGPSLERTQVDHWECQVEADPENTFRLDSQGFAWLGEMAAGRFQTQSLGQLRARLPQSGGGRLRLWVLDGEHPITDIGALQACAPPDSLFQVASQFNCLEAPSPRLVRVADYFYDPTQGPRASISAYPGTLLRHYRCPFVQTDNQQINLLHAAEAPVDCGYLRGQSIADPEALLRRLEERFEELEVGVHEGVEVRLGARWDGPVNPGTRICQVFTSTMAGGGYGIAHNALCRPLLRCAYLGTVMAAAALKQRRVVLTLIGGGVFGNPVDLIWESMLWSLDQVQDHLSRDLTVILNGRNLIPQVPAAILREAARNRGGDLIYCDPAGIHL